MRAVVQRVRRASVTVEGAEGAGGGTGTSTGSSTGSSTVVGEIGAGLLVLLGVAPTDTEADADWMSDRIAGLRIFPDEAGKMNLSVRDAGGQILVVSQFTLYADATRGRRPSFVGAARPEVAEPLYERVAARLGAARGRFGAHMAVSLVNDGPVTLLLDSP